MLIQITAIKEWGFEHKSDKVVEYLYETPRKTLININQIVYIQPIGDGVVQIKMIEHTSFHIKVSYQRFLEAIDEQLQFILE